MDVESLLFNKYRLAIMTLLSKNREMSYRDLKSAVSTTDGNLATHLRKLEDAGFIEVEKTFEGRKPKTIYRITPEGEEALEKFLEELEKILKNFRRFEND